MKNISELKSRKEWEEFIWISFLEKIKNAPTTRQFQEMLEIILSDTEKQLIIRRIIALYLISQKKTYREIGEILWISHCTISNLKKNLRKKSSYQSYYKLRKSRQKISEIHKEELGELSEAAKELLDWIYGSYLFSWMVMTGKIR